MILMGGEGGEVGGEGEGDGGIIDSDVRKMALGNSGMIVFLLTLSC